tara:strand:- start:16519 stop:16851 length:333 start_codon:yes stop_codon:yes gene_type:complete
MSSDTIPESQSDAFRDVMQAARAQPGRAALAHQSPGRTVSDAERALATALMEVYAAGVTGPGPVAAALAGKGVIAPISGRVDWDVDLIETELRALNDSFDAAYQDDGIGA